MNSKPIIFFNDSAYNSRIDAMQRIVDITQPFINEFYRLNVVKITTIPDLITAVMGGEKYIKKELEKTIPPQSFGGIMQDPAKVVDTLALPDFTELNRLSLMCRETAKQLTTCELNGNVLAISKTTLGNIKDEYTVYADTPAKLELYNKANQAVKSLCEFQKALSKVNIGIEILNEFFNVSDKTITLRGQALGGDRLKDK